MAVPPCPFIILVADSDIAVGSVAARLLASALEVGGISKPTAVRVMASQAVEDQSYEPAMPSEVQLIAQTVVSASASDLKNANLIVGFSGLDVVQVNAVRRIGNSAPAVILCQFILNLDEIVTGQINQSSADIDAVLVDAALQFGFAEGSAQCAICALKIGENIDYWIEIADTCSKFAQQIKKLDS